MEADRPTDPRRRTRLMAVLGAASLVPYAYAHGHRELTNATESELEAARRSLRARRHAFLADVALKLGDRERALAQARQALAVDETMPDARRILRRLGALANTD